MIRKDEESSIFFDSVFLNSSIEILLTENQKEIAMVTFEGLKILSHSTSEKTTHNISLHNLVIEDLTEKQDSPVYIFSSTSENDIIHRERKKYHSDSLVSIDYEITPRHSKYFKGFDKNIFVNFNSVDIFWRNYCFSKILHLGFDIFTSTKDIQDYQSDKKYQLESTESQIIIEVSSVGVFVQDDGYDLMLATLNDSEGKICSGRDNIKIKVIHF